MKKDKFVPLNKRSKKEQKEYNKRKRSFMGFNTGTRTMKTEKKSYSCNAERCRKKKSRRLLTKGILCAIIKILQEERN